MTEIDLAPETLADWENYGEPPADEAALAQLTALAKTPLPADYIAFLKTHGFAQWDTELPSWFSYRLEEAGGVVARRTRLAFLNDPEAVAQTLKFGFADDAPNGLPIAPPHMFPIAGTDGSDTILLDKVDGGVWFWPEDRQDPWGTGDNTVHGYVAPTFSDFINNLQPADA